MRAQPPTDITIGTLTLLDHRRSRCWE